MSTKIKVEMKPINTIITRLGVGTNGDVQRFITATINRRITKYMPHRSGALSTKLKHIKSDTEIEIVGPYARVMYYGKLMVDPITGAAGFMDEDGQWKSRKNVPKVLSDRDISYDKTKNLQAGPFWDRRMMATEGSQVVAEVQAYIDKKAGRG